MLSGKSKTLVPCNIHEMPQWADAHIYITMNSDHGSGISFGFGFSGYWFSKNKLGEKKDYGIYCTLMKSLLEISITAFNRERKFIALKFNINKPIIEDLKDARIASFKANSIIDPTVHDFFSKKLKQFLQVLLKTSLQINLSV